MTEILILTTLSRPERQNYHLTIGHVKQWMYSPMIPSLSIVVSWQISFNINKLIVWFQKYPYPLGSYPMDGHWKFQGRGLSKAKIFKGKYQAKLEFPNGGGGGSK